MNTQYSSFPKTRTSRRDFLKTSAALAGTAVVGKLAIGRSAHAAGSDVIKIGLIGCGGRGTSAAINAMNAGKDIHLVALADIFKDKLDAGLKKLQTAKPEQVAVSTDHCFVGFDAYQQLIASGVDAVLIAPASHFIPEQLKVAVDAGKHVFCEKPHGIDMPGVAICEAASQTAKQKRLNLVSGLCWRYDPGLREGMKRVLNGDIGDILALQETYLTVPYYAFDRKPGLSEMEYQFRNWYHFNWLSGDQTAQQLIHSIDKGSWALGDKPPVSVWGMGGRQTCLATKFGDQLDHQTVVFEYPNGVRMFAYTRDQEDCYREGVDYVIGTKGRFKFNWMNYQLTIEGSKNWTYTIPDPKPSMYDVEHQELFASIRAGKPINNGPYMCLSTRLAIAAQMAVYSGQPIPWEKAIASKRTFALPRYGWDVEPPVKPRADGTYDAPKQGKAEFEKWLM